MPNKSRAQSTSVYRKPNALRHGVYSRAAVLPGEDQAAWGAARINETLG